MQRTLAIALGLIVIVAAAGHRPATQLPVVKGVVGRVAVTPAGARPAWILIEETPQQPTGEKVMLTLRSALVLVHREDPDGDRWHVGRRVRARYRGPALASYPTQANAVFVELF